jgi:hypothetical protein
MSNKKKNVVVLVCILAVIAALLLWWRTRVSRSVADQAVPASTAPAVAGQTAKDDTKNPGQANTQEEQPPATRKPSVELRKTFETLNHNAVEFFGRAIDQFGEPVAGAEVRGTLLVNTGTSGSERRAKTTTDVQGYFQFTDMKGQDLGIIIAKEGYEYNRKETSFSYSYFEADHKRHIPDPKNPVIFTLWKKQGAERLIHYNTGMNIPADGSPVRIDLATGKIGGPHADLVISLVRTPLTMRFGERGYEWRSSIEVVDGGLIRAGERDYYNIAPESGYERRVEHVQEAQRVDSGEKWSWKDGITEDFFVTSTGGKRFARVRVAIYSAGRNTNDTIGGVELTVWLNSNGSRNLEFDPAKAITPR